MTRILIIEDEDAVRENIAQLLEFENYQVIEANNGVAGVTLAKVEKPHLIICDIMMPKLDGYGVLRSLREEPSTATIPFIFLTAKATKENVRQGMELGAYDYLTKPFTRKDLLSSIQIQLEKQAVVRQQSESQLASLRSSISLALPHELRTPLNGILGFAEILSLDAETLSTQEIREISTTIYQSAQRLEHLIQNFLLYSDLELTAQDPQKVQELKKQSLSSVSLIIKAIVKQKAKLFNREFDTNVEIADACIQISGKAFRKTIEELMDNAFKFSPPGTKVEIQSTKKNNKLILEITNQGAGISQEKIHQLGAYMQFEREKMAQEGAGLGLVIAKCLTELHGGSFAINSIPNEYTTVQVGYKICE